MYESQANTLQTTQTKGEIEIAQLKTIMRDTSIRTIREADS